ncbi:hypothetical protein [Methylobacterium sp. 77]|uniref:hypothetical protein n=1 Tax=Methylobacterium sp. 77 TaxID=1101192 RepID=UPI00036A9C20|nr:hypothetical protein [Methylobacterium sp. 77]
MTPVDRCARHISEALISTTSSVVDGIVGALDALEASYDTLSERVTALEAVLHIVKRRCRARPDMPDPRSVIASIDQRQNKMLLEQA